LLEFSSSFLCHFHSHLARRVIIIKMQPSSSDLFNGQHQLNDIKFSPKLSNGCHLDEDGNVKGNVKQRGDLMLAGGWSDANTGTKIRRGTVGSGSPKGDFGDGLLQSTSPRIKPKKLPMNNGNPAVSSMVGRRPGAQDPTWSRPQVFSSLSNETMENLLSEGSTQDPRESLRGSSSTRHIANDKNNRVNLRPIRRGSPDLTQIRQTERIKRSLRTSSEDPKRKSSFMNNNQALVGGSSRRKIKASVPTVNLGNFRNPKPTTKGQRDELGAKPDRLIERRSIDPLYPGMDLQRASLNYYDDSSSSVDDKSRASCKKSPLTKIKGFNFKDSSKDGSPQVLGGGWFRSDLANIDQITEGVNRALRKGIIRPTKQMLTPLKVHSAPKSEGLDIFFTDTTTENSHQDDGNSSSSSGNTNLKKGRSGAGGNRATTRVTTKSVTKDSATISRTTQPRKTITKSNTIDPSGWNEDTTQTACSKPNLILKSRLKNRKLGSSSGTFTTSVPGSSTTVTASGGDSATPSTSQESLEAETCAIQSELSKPPADDKRKKGQGNPRLPRLQNGFTASAKPKDINSGALKESDIEKPKRDSPSDVSSSTEFDSASQKSGESRLKMKLVALTDADSSASASASSSSFSPDKATILKANDQSSKSSKTSELKLSDVGDSHTDLHGIASLEAGTEDDDNVQKEMISKKNIIEGVVGGNDGDGLEMSHSTPVRTTGKAIKAASVLGMYSGATRATHTTTTASSSNRSTPSSNECSQINLLKPASSCSSNSPTDLLGVPERHGQFSSELQMSQKISEESENSLRNPESNSSSWEKSPENRFSSYKNAQNDGQQELSGSGSGSGSWGEVAEDGGGGRSTSSTMSDKFDNDPNIQRFNEYKVTSMIKDPFFEGTHGHLIKWKAGRFIGAGKMGQVIKAMDSESGKIFAVKRLFFNPNIPEQAEFVQCLEDEIDLLKSLKHPHIVQYLGSERVAESLCVYLEYMAGGSIASILQNYGQLEERTIQVYTKQILRGLAYLHGKQVVHRDIKGQNILVDTDGTVKLADFGCSKKINSSVSSSEMITSIKGSIPWMAPEVVAQKGHGRKADIWAMGCTVIEMASADNPWGHFDNHIAAIMKIAKSNDLPAIPDHLSEKCKDFIISCLHRNPQHRPSASDLLQHPFITGESLPMKDPPVDT